MIRDFSRALAQLGDPKFLWVLVKALGLTIGLFATAFYLLVSLGSLLPGSVSLPWIGDIPLGDWFDGLAFVGVLVSSAFLMFPVAMLFIGLFLEEIADAVEARYYPGLPAARHNIVAMVMETLRFLGIMMVANLLALIIYFASTLLAPVIFWLVNGYLLGREYFQLVAMRRLGLRGADKLRKRYRWQIWLAGILMAVPLSVPVLNLLVPLLGVATFTHQFHRLSAKHPPQS